MRPRKLSREQLMLQCAACFKQHGYTGASVSLLAQSCGLSKAAFYYDFSSKDELLLEILTLTHQQLTQSIFAALRQPYSNLMQAYEHIHSAALRFFNYGGIGCLAGILSAESANLPETLRIKVHDIFQDWEKAFTAFFTQCMDSAQAKIWAQLSVCDYEGAILLSRIRPESDYLCLVKMRVLQQLQAAAA